MPSRLFLLTLLVLLLALLVAACVQTQAEANPASGEDPALPVVRYANFRVYDPVYVAIDQGFFAQHGIQVEMIGDVLGGPTAIQAVAAGSAEAGLSSLPAIVNANAAGLPILGVSDIQSALPGQPLEVYFVRSDSAIDSLADLPGHTFAVNLWRSSFHYTALMALDQAGVPEADVEFVLLPFDAQTQALLNGDVDVIGLMQPYISQTLALYAGEVRELFTALDVFGTKQFTTHFVNRLWAQYHPEQAAAFVAGIVDAIAWIEANQDAARPIIARYTGIAEEHIPDYHFQPQGQVVEADVQFWLDYLLERGDVTAAWLVPDQIASNIYNPSVAQE